MVHGNADGTIPASSTRGCKAAAGSGPPATIANGKMLVGDAGGKGGRMDVWLVRYDPSIGQVATRKTMDGEWRSHSHKLSGFLWLLMSSFNQVSAHVHNHRL